MKKKVSVDTVTFEDLTSDTNYWVESYARHYFLDKDDLRQEGFFVFIKAKDSFKEGKGRRFDSWYTLLLKNRFDDLYRKEMIRKRDVVSNEAKNDENEEVVIFDLIASKNWTPEQQYIWNELLREVEGRLKGLSLEVFRQKMSPTLEMHKKSRAGKMSFTDFCKFFDVKREDISLAYRNIQRSVLIALGERPSVIKEKTKELVTTF